MAVRAPRVKRAAVSAPLRVDRRPRERVDDVSAGRVRVGGVLRPAGRDPVETAPL